MQEELSIAKVKEKEDRGFRVLPVLIDDITLPVSLKHIQYADLRNWRDQEAYRKALLALLRSIGVQPRLAGGDELRWYARHSGVVRGIHSALHRIYGELEGGFAVSIGEPPSDSPFVRPRYYRAVKWAFEEDDVLGLLSRLEKALSDRRYPISDRLLALRNKVETTLDFGKKQCAYRSDWNDSEKLHQFWQSIGTVSSMLDDFRGEVEIALLKELRLGEEITGAQPKASSGRKPRKRGSAA